MNSLFEAPAILHLHRRTKVFQIYISAAQLIEFPYGDGPEVVLGGGRQNFMKNTSRDPEYNKTGKRKDGRNLISEWTQKNTRGNTYEYVWRTKEFSLLNPSKVDHILGE